MYDMSPVSKLATRFVRQTQNQIYGSRCAHKRSFSAASQFASDYDKDFSNATERILSKVGKGLLHKPNHPLNIIKTKIHKYFSEEYPKITTARVNNRDNGFKLFDDLHPVVSVYQNFDSLLTPHDHVSRSKNDTYYMSCDKVLRTHTSAHQRDLIAEKHQAFLVAGDVYRRDEIDKSHYPVFHQMEGVRMFKMGELIDEGEEIIESGVENEKKQREHTHKAVLAAEKDLKAALEGMANYLFGDVEMRWVETYFPFTHPSWELEIFFDGDWLEVLGSGVTRQGVVSAAGVDDRMGWAFGLGLERLAMVLYQVPDIRLFWSDDERFLSQFDVNAKGRTIFQPFSKHPPCLKDISFWVDKEFSSNSFFEVVRSVAGDLVEDVKLVSLLFLILIYFKTLN